MKYVPTISFHLNDHTQSFNRTQKIDSQSLIRFKGKTFAPTDPIVNYYKYGFDEF